MLGLSWDLLQGGESRAATHSLVLVPTDVTYRYLTLSTCLARGGDEAIEPHVDVHLHAQQQSHLQQDQLELTDTCKGREGYSGLHPTVSLVSSLPPGSSLMWSSMPVQKRP